MSRRSKHHTRRAPTAPALGSPARTETRKETRSWRGAGWLGGLLLAAVTFIAYQHVWHAGFIWDDDGHVTNSALRPVHGLWRIWFEPGATQQYYPFLYSAFWLEYRLWGSSAWPYHLLNIALHLAAAGLLYRVLRRLAVPGAFLAVCIFALHPVCVESVAWISEQKNTLSAVFYFAAALAYLRYDEDRLFRWYVLGIGLFALALASKSVTATLPAALLVMFWWKRGRLSWKSDVLPLVPWFLLAIGAGAMTAWIERTHVGASGAAYQLGFIERLLVAGRASWFYLGRFFWPDDLIFIYPRWTVNGGELWQYVYPTAALISLAILVLVRKRARGPLAVALLFVGTLFPALGFINVFPFLYSYVADHFQYLAVAIMSGGVAAGFNLGVSHLESTGRWIARSSAIIVLAVFATLTWRQGIMYRDKETLWRTTIALNPACWMAYNNLGSDLLQNGRVDEAIEAIKTSLEYEPENPAAYTNLGNALWKKGDARNAIEQFQKALAEETDNVPAHINLGNVLLQTGRVRDAITHYQKALAIKPNFAKAHTNLGDAYLQNGQIDDAIAQYGIALENDPDDVEAHTNLGASLAQKGRSQEAIDQFRSALAINPHFAIAQTNLGNAFLQMGKIEDAISSYREAVRIKPDFAKAHTHLGDALLQSRQVEEAVAEYKKALEYDPNDVEANSNLGTILAQRHHFEEAVTYFRAAIRINPNFVIALTNLAHVLLQRGEIDEAIVHYRKVLELVPSSTPARRGLDYALAERARLNNQSTQFGGGTTK